MRIRRKILLFILTTSILIFSVTIFLITYYSRQVTLDRAIQMADASAEKAALIVKTVLEEDLATVRTMSHSFLGFDKIKPSMRKPVYQDMMKHILEQNNDYLAVWTSFQLWAIDSSWLEDYGRVRYVVNRNNNILNFDEDSLELDGDITEGLYYQIKVNKQEFITNPYWFSYTDSQKDQILEASLAVPLLYQGRFAGLGGIDVPLERFNEIIKDISPVKESYAFLIANNGNYVAYSDKEMINTSFTDYMEAQQDKDLFMDNVKNGRAFSFNRISKNKKEYVTFYPIQLGATQTPWSIGVVIPLNVIMEEPNRIFTLAILGGLFGLIIMSVIILAVTRNVVRPIKQTTDLLNELAKGKIDSSLKLEITSSDEMSQMASSVNTLIDELTRTTNLATEISKGNLDTHLELLSDEDVLGKSLMQMQKSLLEAREEVDQRNQEDQRYTWVTTGIAKFGEMLRIQHSDMPKFHYDIIRNLVKYVEVNQGGLFLLHENEEEKYIEMASSYAYDKAKGKETRIDYGVGLIGRCIKENETIYITNLPSDYLEVGSGLGGSRPKYLLVVPLRVNAQVLGAVEIASFTEIEPHKREFVEQIGESIGVTILNLRNNIRTSMLLEESKQKSHELAEKEAELRENLTELKAAQAEMKRMKDQEAERFKEIGMMREETKKMLQNIINTVPAYIFLKDEEGKYRFVNDSFAGSINNKDKRLVGKSDYSFLSEEEATFVRNIDQDVLTNGAKTYIHKSVIEGRIYIYQTTKIPFYIDFIERNGILCMQNDITGAFKGNEHLLDDFETIVVG